MKKILIVLTTALLLAACSNDNDPAAINDGRRVPLQVRGYIADTPLGITRASNSSWEADDQIGLYALFHNTTTPIEDGSNVCYIFAGTPEPTNGSTYKAFTSTTTINLPEDGSPIDVYGYYPYSAGPPIDPTAMAVNLSTQNPQKNIDLMTTGKVSTSTHDGNTLISINEPSCELLFRHRLTKLEFNLTFIDFDDIKNTSLTIGSQKTTATYNIYTDELTYGSGEAYQTITAAEISSSNDNLKTFEAIVLPNHADNNRTPNERKVTIVVDGKSYSFTIVKTGADSNNKVLTDSFDAGYKYVYNVTVYPFTITVDPDKYTEQW